MCVACQWSEVEKGAYLHTKYAEKILRFPKFAEKIEEIIYLKRQIKKKRKKRGKERGRKNKGKYLSSR